MLRAKEDEERKRIGGRACSCWRNVTIGTDIPLVNSYKPNPGNGPSRRRKEQFHKPCRALVPTRKLQHEIRSEERPNPGVSSDNRPPRMLTTATGATFKIATDPR